MKSVKNELKKESNFSFPFDLPLVLVIKIILRPYSHGGYDLRLSST